MPLAEFRSSNFRCGNRIYSSHLALASYHKFDYLLTWNCEHLANANKAGHIRWINTVLGLYVPMLITPLQLMGE